MPFPWWFRSALALIGVALALFLVPTRYEGPVLVDVSAGHAIAIVDAIAIVPLAAGSSLLYFGLWRERAHLLDRVRRDPASAVLGAFVAGTGLGLLLSSAFSSWRWWWAVGAGLFGAGLLGACVLIVCDRRARTRSGEPYAHDA